MISIICPFYNEKENLQPLHQRLKAVMEQQKKDFEIIFVNDQSTDNGPAHLRSLIAGDPRMRVIDLEVRQGLSGALLAGFEVSRGEVLVTLDSDLQNPPEEIPKLLEWIDRFDAVTGIREKRRDTWVRKISSRVANNVRRYVTGDHIQDIGCTLRAFHRRVLVCFHPYHNMHRFFMAFAERDGFSIKQVLVKHAERLYEKAKYGLSNRTWQGIRDLMAVRWMMRQRIRYMIKKEHS